MRLKIDIDDWLNRHIVGWGNFPRLELEENYVQRYYPPSLFMEPELYTELIFTHMFRSAISSEGKLTSSLEVLKDGAPSLMLCKTCQ